MNRVFEILKIHPGEERTAALLVGLMLFTSGGGALGGNAIEALFFARFGVALLPTMYIILGLFSFTTSMAITALMGRVAKQRLYVALPVILALVLISERLVILLNLKWFFAVMWLVMNVIGSLQGLLTWGLAGAACDTRQAKRLFPLFSAGGILGTILGGLVTSPLADWLHSENLILIWAAALFVSFLLGRALTGNSQPPPPVAHARQPGIGAEMQRGYQFVRRSPIMQWVSYSAILFSVCYFSLALPFSRGATAQFPNADQLAGFLGLFQSLNTVAALLLSLFLANRLFARFGIMPMLLLFPAIYLAGFASLAIAAPFALLVGVRFAQMAYMNGIAGTSFQALYNVVPPEQRDQVRAFVGGVPEQAGTFIAGLILVVGEQALQPRQLYLVGSVAAALTVYIIWRASRAYRQALVEALRAGQPQMFYGSAQPLGGLPTDAAAVSVAVRGLSDPDASIRRISAEMVSNMQVPEAAAVLAEGLVDEDAQVRAAALKGLARAGVAPALLDIAASLCDPEPEVRCAAIDALRQLAATPRGIVAHIEPLLSDSEPLVRVKAALALLHTASHALAWETLHGMAADSDPTVRAQALDALAECGDGAAYYLAATALEDGHPKVRQSASAALAAVNPAAASALLIAHLNDSDTAVRRTLAESLGKIGEPALPALMDALSNPAFEDGALMALQVLPVQKSAGKIRAHAQASAQTALHYYGLAQGMAQKYDADRSGDGRVQLLMDSLAEKGRRSGLNALRALGLLGAREAVAVAVDNLRSRYPIQRANALETLEALGEAEIIRPLLTLWETGGTAAAPLPETWLMDLLEDPYAWLRACAVLVAGREGDSALLEKIKTISRTDPDEIVRAAAENELLGDSAMDTLATLSLMERILFLRRVPLFADLPPADLKQVANAASEVLFSAGQVIARQGELGTEMYIIVSGEVRVTITAPNQTEAREVARRRSGDYVGEMSVINMEPRIATLVTDGPLRALCLRQKQFEGILRERPEICLAMLRTLSQRLKEASESAVVV